MSSTRNAITVNYCFGGKITERVSDLRESFVEVFVIPRVEDGFVGFDSYGAIAVELDFFCGVRRYVALKMLGQLGRGRNRLRCHIIPIRSSGSGEVPVWPDRKTLPNWVLSGLPVICPEIHKSRFSRDR